MWGFRVYDGRDFRVLRLGLLRASGFRVSGFRVSGFRVYQGL